MPGDRRDTDPVPQEDYAYDLAHERTDAAAPPRETRDADHVCVPTETDDTAGDYGYDLSHDVPRR